MNSAKSQLFHAKTKFLFEFYINCLKIFLKNKIILKMKIRLYMAILVAFYLVSLAQADGCSLNNILQCCPLANSTQCGTGSCSTYYYKSIFSNQGICTTCTILDLNCKTCTQNGCNQCLDGWTLSSNKSCVSNKTCSVLDCAQCTQSIGCFVCKEGFILNIFNQTCTKINCDNNSFCCPAANSSQCGIGSCSAFYYNPNVSLCVSCMRFDFNCKTCTSSNCTSCSDGFTLSSNNTCGNQTCNLTNCKKCSQLGCLQCQQSYVLNLYNFTCTQSNCSAQNCSVCLQSKCIICSTGYLLTNGSCQPFCGPFCNNCVSPGKCESCLNYTTLDLQTNICNINCSLGFDGKCTKCQNLIFCKTCQDGYRLAYQNTVCQKIQNCSVENCRRCTNTSLCEICNIGYALQLNNSCDSDICFIPFCKKCSTVSTCESCADNYTLAINSTVCIYSCSITNCSICLNSTSCQLCNPGYKLGNNTCSPLCNISSCSVCLSQSTCIICSRNSTLSSDGKSCKIRCNDLSCSTCTNSTICQTCILGYSLNSKGKCKRQCMFGFALSQNKTCQKCSFYSSNCQNCIFDNSSSIFQCTQCLTGSFLQLGVCFSCDSTLSNCKACRSSSECLVCKFGYKLESKVCSLKDCSAPNCQTCQNNSSMLCSNCSNGFVANSLGICVFNCKSGQSLIKGACSCPYGTYDSGSSCTVCSDSNCINCTQSDCLICRMGFYASGSSCLSCINNCYLCTDSSSCNLCQPPYIYSNGSCANAGNGFSGTTDDNGNIFSCPAGCDSCSLGNQNSLVCNYLTSGYSQLQGKIIKCSSLCLTCSGSNTCLSCYPGYTLSGDKCINCSDLYATTCSPTNTNYSLACVSGYTTVSNDSASQCQRCASNCYKCDINGSNTCDKGQCSIGYVQLSGTQNCTLCFNNCPSCSQSDPSKCLSCGMRRYKDKDGQCMSCPVGCKECSSNTNCSSCFKGFAIVNNLCQFGPVWPCSKGTNQTCSQCVSSFTLQNGLCIYNGNCNDTSNCTSCSYGYYLVTLLAYSSGKCYVCPNITNCVTCDSSNSSSCLMCKSGYYVQMGSCTVCLGGCAQCSSGNYCSQAQSGYYLFTNPDGSYSGQTGACSSPCKTCDINPNFCLSCVNGYVINGSMCFSAKVIYYSMTFNLPSLFNSNDTFSEAYGKIIKNIGYLKSTICQNLPKKITKNDTNCQKNFIFLQFKSGSVQYSSAIDGSSYSSSSDAEADMSSTNLIPNAQVVSSSTIMEGYQKSSSSQTSSSNIGLIVGLSISFAVILIGVVIFLVIYCKKRTSKHYVEGSQKAYQGSQQSLPDRPNL